MAAIGSTTSTTAAQASSGSGNVFSGMDGDAFLQLLVAQMRYQNPMSPSDPTAMMGQIATYAQVEALNKIQSGQSSDMMMNAARMATELVGKTVTATDGSTTESGKVTAARFTADGPVLVLDSGIELTLGAVISVTDPVPATATSAASSSSGSGSSSGTSSSSSSSDSSSSSTT